MIAVDTNLLVYAHRTEFTLHREAVARLRELAESPTRWGIPLHCLVEFVATVTNGRKFAVPSGQGDVSAQIDAWRASPSLVILADREQVLTRLLALIGSSRVGGGQVHDARIAAVCIENGVTEFWTVDRDYSRFPSLRVRNPLRP